MILADPYAQAVWWLGVLAGAIALIFEFAVLTGPWMSTGGSASWCERCERPKGLFALTSDDSENEPPDIVTEDDFEI